MKPYQPSVSRINPKCQLFPAEEIEVAEDADEEETEVVNETRLRVRVTNPASLEDPDMPQDLLIQRVPAIIDMATKPGTA